MKIFSMNECDWYVGETLESCVADYHIYFSDDTEEARELTEEELNKLIFIDTNEDEYPTGDKRTFREQLAIEIEKGGPFPRLFATTEH